MLPTPLRQWRVATLFTMVPLLASCGDDMSQATGALGGDSGQMTFCTPVAGSGPVVAADEFLRNESTEALVRLVDPDGLTLLDVSLLPVRDQTLLGTSASPPRSPVWAERREGIGAQLKPGETWNLALTLNRNQGHGSFADVEVAYTTGGDSSNYRLRYALTVIAEPTCEGVEG